MSNIRGPQNWDVKNGKAVLVTPAVAAKTEEVPVERLDRQIERIAARKARIAESLAAAQAELTELEKFEAELKALRAKITQ